MAQSLFQSSLYAAQFGDAEVSALFSDAAEVSHMVRFERALARVQGQLGVIPVEAGAAIDQNLKSHQVNLEGLSEGVCNSGVPVPALVADLRRALSEDHGQWLHWGATSQDVMDVAQVFVLSSVFDVLEVRLEELTHALRAKSNAFSETVMAGRTRGQISTPITFGLRIAKWAQPLLAARASLSTVKARALRIQFGGASGANTAIAPHGAEVMHHLAKELGLEASVPWHVDRSGIIVAAHWALEITVALAKYSDDLILLMRSEIGEVSAGAGGGSSTMPQKSNPVGPETIKVLASLAQSAHAGLLRSAVHAEERDGGQWPVEWALLPQLFIATGAALRHAVVLAETMDANHERMTATLEQNTGVMAERASFILAAHMSRVKAQALVKEAVLTGKPLADALAELSDLSIDWPKELAPDQVVTSCKAISDHIFKEF